MNLGNNHTEAYRVEIDDDNESFHSFTQSDGDSPDLGSFTDIDDDSIRDAPNLEFENIAIKNLKLSSDSKPADCSLDESASFVNPNQYQTPKLLPLRNPLQKCHHLVPPLKNNCQMPDMELFNMNLTPATKNDPINSSVGTEALQKYAFTEIWVEEQQNIPGKRRSLHREFTAALEDYFHDKNTDRFKSMTEEEQQKDQLKLKPNQRNTAPSANFQATSESIPYVSPFEDMPEFPDEKILPGLASYITVPAGYDLSNLVEYKDPNHWHRRSSTLNDYHP
ncbi:uncharacterized protein LOC111599820 [Drosophila hydei]|uniref:Uncharacterized protein LOC111599820 n=1 Tax=Drosophila hydei TaxID=7224 RepID=A0A6J1LTR8_DROHY|nr:uncharacterized protein LOC111599820 [Drosophila hydei]